MFDIDLGKIFSGISEAIPDRIADAIASNTQETLAVLQNIDRESLVRACDNLSDQILTHPFTDYVASNLHLYNLALIYSFNDSSFVKNQLFNMRPPVHNSDLPDSWVNMDFQVNDSDIECRYLEAENESAVFAFVGGFYSNIAEYQEALEHMSSKYNISFLIAQHPDCGNDDWLDSYQRIPKPLLKNALDLAQPNSKIIFGGHSAGCANIDRARSVDTELKDMINSQVDQFMYFFPFFGPNGSSEKFNPECFKLYAGHATRNARQKYMHTWADIGFSLFNIRSIRKARPIEKETPYHHETLSLIRKVGQHVDQVESIDDYRLSGSRMTIVLADNDHLISSESAEYIAEHAGAKICRIQGGHHFEAEQLEHEDISEVLRRITHSRYNDIYPIRRPHIGKYGEFGDVDPSPAML